MRTRFYPSKDVAEKHTDPDVPGAEVYLYTMKTPGGEYPAAYGWKSEKQVNHDFHHRFRDEAHRVKFLTDWFATLKRVAAVKQERKNKFAAAKEQPNPYTEGQVLYNSWGYEQTNIDFAKVIKVAGQTLTLVKIGKETVEQTGDLTGYVVARKDREIGEPFTKRVQYHADGTTYIKADHGLWSPWDGKKLYQTGYY